MKIDGKEVRKFLFARYTSVMANGAIPVDRKERAKILNEHDQARRFLVNVQVEAFSKDHAIERLQKIYPHVTKKEWEFVDELDASHDLGMMGASHPFDPLVMPTHRRVQ